QHALGSSKVYKMIIDTLLLENAVVFAWGARGVRNNMQIVARLKQAMFNSTLATARNGRQYRNTGLAQHLASTSRWLVAGYFLFETFAQFHGRSIQKTDLFF